jgi:hypothetical protein
MIFGIFPGLRYCTSFYLEQPQMTASKTEGSECFDPDTNTVTALVFVSRRFNHYLPCLQTGLCVLLWLQYCDYLIKLCCKIVHFFTELILSNTPRMHVEDYRNLNLEIKCGWLNTFTLLPCYVPGKDFGPH